jgi:hypothetical protein
MCPLGGRRIVPRLAKWPVNKKSSDNRKGPSNLQRVQYDCKVNRQFSSRALLPWLSVAAAIAIGPIFVCVGYAMRLVYGLAALAYFFCCAAIVPLITAIGGRIWFLSWQLAIVSLVAAVIEDNLRLNAIHGREIVSVAYGFWAIGAVLSSPLPIFLLLHPLKPRQRYIVGAGVAAVGLAIWFGMAKIVK